MTLLRAEKIAGIAKDIPPVEVNDPTGDAEVLVLAWGSTFGPVRAACRRLRNKGQADRARAPAPPQPVPGATSATSSESYKKVVVPEHNLGQLLKMVRDRLPRRRAGVQQGRGDAVQGARARSCVRRGAGCGNSRSSRRPVMTDTNGHTNGGNGSRVHVQLDEEGLRVRPGRPVVPGLR